MPEIIRTLIDRRERPKPSVLPEELRIAYGGDLWFPPSGSQRLVVSGSGRTDLTRAIFRTAGIRTLIVTTQGGSDLLAASGVGSLISTEVRTLEGPIVAPASILELLRTEFGVSLLLHEGGPTLFGSFVANGCVDELFLTIAPQVAGRNRQPPRPGLIAGVEFLPEAAPWLDIVSVKERGNRLYLRYSAV